ncbi:MAG TPA: hypothetical protein VF029_04145 [Actinomycetota bacterium]
MSARVTLADPEPNGLAEMVSRLLRANLDAHPRRARLLRTAVVELAVVDADVETTLRLAPGLVEVANGPANPAAEIRIRARAQDLLAMPAAPLLLGVPNPLRRDGRGLLRQIARREVRVSGMLRHPVLLSRFARLLSVA